MKKTFILYMVLFLALWSAGQAQTDVNIGSQAIVTGCNINIYDDGGASGNYGASNDYTLTIYPGNGQGRTVIEVLNIDIHYSDTLYIYDGTSATGTPLVALNNDNAYLYTSTVMATQNNPSGALTVRFRTSFFLPIFGNHGAGFALHATCSAACQPFQIVLDTVRCTHLPVLNPDDSYYYIDLCPDEQVTLAVKGLYGQSIYPRSDTSTYFIWNLETGVSFNGTGMSEVTHQFTAGNGYEVSILATDSLQCPAQQPVTFRVRSSKSPIAHLGAIPEMCVDQTFTPVVGYEAGSHIQIEEVGYAQNSSLIVRDTVFLPDGENCPPYGTYYRSNVTFTDFTPGATVTSANDILYVRIKMEHSAIEDLRIDIYCPNGSSSNILPHPNFSYGYYNNHLYYRVNLGVARRPDGGSCNPALNIMGEPWNYVWSNNNTQGYQYASANGCFYDISNMSNHYNPHWDDGYYTDSVDSTNVAAMTQVYHPFQNFSSLVGCPLNGNWYIQVQDLYNEDNGYIVEWELALSPELLPAVWDYNVEVDTFYFTGNQVIGGTTLQPSEAGNQPYVFHIVDDFGCPFDTTITVTVHDIPEVSLGDDRQICTGNSVTLGPESVYNNYLYRWNTGATTPQITVSESGIYSLTASSTLNGIVLCQSSDTVEVAITTPTTTTLTDEICAGNDYSDNGFTISAAELQQPGTHTTEHTLIASNGCDSTVTLNLTVLPNVTTVIEQNVCDSLRWNDELFTESGNYTRSFTAGNGCDSTVTLRLSVGHPETEELTVDVCGKYVWDNETLTESGDYHRTFVSSHECDSIVTLHLTVVDTFLHPSESNPDFCATQETTLSVDGNFDDYVWSTGEVGTFIFVTQSGRYSVTASNHACERVAVFDLPYCPLTLILPNAITPSRGEGLNDVLFLPQYMQNQIGEFSIAIFNRWGELVYFSEDKNFRWDGTKDGKLMVNAVYSYVLRCTDRNGKAYTFTGSVTVL